jgi:hypothetical protein
VEPLPFSCYTQVSCIWRLVMLNASAILTRDDKLVVAIFGIDYLVYAREEEGQALTDEEVACIRQAIDVDGFVK